MRKTPNQADLVAKLERTQRRLGETTEALARMRTSVAHLMGVRLALLPVARRILENGAEPPSRPEWDHLQASAREALNMDAWAGAPTPDPTMTKP